MPLTHKRVRRGKPLNRAERVAFRAILGSGDWTDFCKYVLVLTHHLITTHLTGSQSHLILKDNPGTSWYILERLLLFGTSFCYSTRFSKSCLCTALPIFLSITHAQE